MSKMRSSMIRQAGFTLLEIAIVMVIVAMLAGGVVAGREVLKSAKLKSVTDDIGTITRAAQEFQKIHGGLPGDLYDARNKLGDAAAIRGNGNGILENPNNFGDNEIRGFWQHLALSGLLPGNYNGASDAPGVGTKAGKLPQSGYYVRTNPVSNELEISFSRFNGGPGRAVLTPEQALELDRKHDDGNPSTGFIRATNGSDTAGTSCVNAGAYVMGNDTVTCIIQTRTQNTGRSAANTAEAAATTSAVACPGGDGGVANTAVGGFRTCTCATDMTGVCRERCLAGGIWEYDAATSTCQYPPCLPVALADQRYTFTAQSSGVSTYADFTGTVLANGTASPTGTPLNAMARGSCNTGAGYIGYIGNWPPDGGSNRFDSAYPQLKCLVPGGTKGFQVNNPVNNLVGRCELGQCSDVALDPMPPSGHTTTAGMPLLVVGNPARTLACPASGFSSGTFQVSCLLSPTPVLTVTSSTCVARSCAALVYTIPGHPTKSVTLPLTTHGSTRVVACPVGMTGNVTGTCQWGDFTRIPITDTCTPNSCPATFCYPGHPTRCVTMPMPLTHGTVSTGMACPTGMTGTWEATCSYGTWTKTGAGTCTPNSCGGTAHGGSQSQSCSPSCACGVASNGSQSRSCSYGAWGGWGGCSGGSCNSCCTSTHLVSSICCTFEGKQEGCDNCNQWKHIGSCGGYAPPTVGCAFSCSDRRLKKDIVLVGKKNGLNLYTFRYKNDLGGTLYRGVMAQEVEHLPGAVVYNEQGYRLVNYGVIGVPFERLDQ